MTNETPKTAHGSDVFPSRRHCGTRPEAYRQGHPRMLLSASAANMKAGTTLRCAPSGLDCRTIKQLNDL